MLRWISVTHYPLRIKIGEVRLYALRNIDVFIRGASELGPDLIRKLVMFRHSLPFMMFEQSDCLKSVPQ